MSEKLPYSQTNLMFDRSTQLIDRSTEVQDVAADMSRFGAIALASEVESRIAIGESVVDPTFASPVNARDLRKKTYLNLEGSSIKMFKREVPGYASRSNEGLDKITQELRIFSSGSTDTTAVRSYIRSETKALQWEQNQIRMGSTEMIMAGRGSVPNFLRPQIARDNWANWVTRAPEEQVVNFSQWYTERLKVLSNPEQREAFVDDLKGDYARKVRQAMSDGWISGRHAKALQKGLDHQRVIMFSPFGTIVLKEFGGIRQNVALSRTDVVGFPTTVEPGSWTSTHEFGHGFANFDPKTAIKAYTDQVGKKRIKERPQILEGLRVFTEIVKEGFNEHMTAALIEGAPTVISPAEREEIGIPSSDATSDQYHEYREVFAVLVGGDDPEQALTVQEMSQLVDSMVDKDYVAFCEFVAKRWGGRDVVREIVHEIDEEFSEPVTSKNADFKNHDRVIDILNTVLLGASQQKAIA